MDKQKKIQGNFMVEYSNYIVRDHRIRGIRVMPGVTFLDIIYRIALSGKINFKRFKLSDIVFEKPIAMEENCDRNVNFVLEPKESFWEFKISSYNVDQADGEELNFYGKLEETGENDIGKRKLDVKTLIECAESVEDMDDEYKKVRNFGVTHYEFMKTSGTVYEGKNYILAHLKTGQLASEYEDRFFIHPALMDASTIVALGQIETAVRNEKKNPFIPLYIKEFYAERPTKKGCYVYFEKKRNQSMSKKLLYTTFEIYDEEGAFLAYFDQLAAAEVRNMKSLAVHKEEITEVITEKKLETEQKLQGAVESAFSDEKVSSIDEVEELLKRMIAGMLKKETYQISSTLDYYQQGMDSSNLLALVKALEEHYQVQLYPTLLFEYSNIKELAEYLFENAVSDRSSDIIPKQPAEQEIVKEVSYYKTAWLERKANKENEQTGAVILVNPGNKEAARLEELWRQSGVWSDGLIVINRGTKFLEKSHSSFEINFSDEEDYRKLMQRLDCRKEKIQQTLYLSGSSDDAEADCLEFIVLFTKLWQQVMTAEQHRMVIMAAGPGSVQKARTLASAGFFHTVILENPKWYYNIVDLGMVFEEKDIQEIFSLIVSELKCADSNQELRYEGGIRLAKQYVNIADVKKTTKLRENGVYIVTGGAGGLGRIISGYLTSQYHAKVIVTGRRSKEEISSLGENVSYIQADITEIEEARHLVQFVKQNYGHIHGVIHCAGLIKDVFSRNNRTEDVFETAAPKIYGAVYLDEALKQESADFIVYCSSTTAEMGNVGQSAYGYANSFLDHFAAYQNEEYGQVVSINWPFWKDGGMQADKKTLEALEQQVGISPLDTECGLKALEFGLSCGLSQLIVIQGKKEKINQLIEQKNQPFLFTPKQEKQNETAVQKKETGYHHGLYSDDEIAIIGIAGRYPKADNLEEFWNNLSSGKDCISKVPLERWDNKKYYDKNKGTAGATYTNWGGFVNDADRFDALFFNMPPQVAKFTDPQERLFLQTAWEAMEDSGYTRADLSRAKAGVFIGVMWAQYQLYKEKADGRYVSPTCMYASIANRTSYVFNLTGPSIALDTMCSSSITAVHLACDSLRKGECRLAIAGGVNLTLHPNKYVFLAQQNFASSDGRCRSFGEGGDGYVPGEGIGAVILKPLKDAVKDKDQIYAVIKGSSINAGGRTSGYTVPSSVEQGRVIRETLDKSGVSARTVSVIEAHGTGTSIGDPIEMGGLIRSFKKETQDKGFCSIGSVKSNIGHLESAAGIAAVTKVVLEMKYNKIVPSLHSKRLNPNIDFVNSPFYVQQTLEDWKKPVVKENGICVEYPRRAGISAFGAGGSNAHIILEQYEGELKSEVRKNEEQLFVLSAKNEERLLVYVQRYIQFLLKNEKNKTEESQFAEIMVSVAEFVKNMAAGLLSLESSALDENDCLLEYGMDKVAFNKLYEELKEKYGIVSDFWEVLENSTIRKLSEFLATNVVNAENVVDSEAILDFDALIFTSQCGREHMDERLAVVSKDQSELCLLLTQFLRNPSLKNDKIFHGNIRNSKEVSDLLSDGELGRKIAEQYRKENNIAKIAKLWVLGVTVDFESMYRGDIPGRISLPSYPFLKNRYWIDNEFDNYVESEHRNGDTQPKLNLQKSIGNGLCYEVWAERKENSFSGFKIQDGYRVPFGWIMEEIFLIHNGLTLLDIQWKEPPEFESDKMRIEMLLKQDSNQILLQISWEQKIFCTAKYGLHTNIQKTERTLSFDKLKKDMQEVCRKTELYKQQALSMTGMEYRILNAVWRKEEILLAEYECKLEKEHDCCISYVMEGILQVSILLLSEEAHPDSDWKADTIDIIEKIPQRGFLYGVRKDGKADIHILDTEGNKLAMVSCMAYQKKEEKQDIPLFYPDWEEEVQTETEPNIGKLHVLIVGNEETADEEKYLRQYHQKDAVFTVKTGEYEKLEKNELPDVVYYLGGITRKMEEHSNLEELRRLETKGVVSLFSFVKKIGEMGGLERNIEIKVLTYNVYRVLDEDVCIPYAAGMNGFLRTLVKEYDKVKASYMDFDQMEPIQTNLRYAILEAAGKRVKDVAFRHGRRYVKNLIPIELESKEQAAFRKNGVYIIAGGMGSIGMDITKYLLKYYNADVILIGRSTKEQVREKMDEFGRYGGNPLYRQCDITDKDAFQELVYTVKEQFGKINGMIHSAVVFQEKPIHDITKKEFLSCLDTKMAGTMVLYQVLQEEDLDFMVFFSSGQSFLQNASRAHYAAGCCFQDAYGLSLQGKSKYPVKVMNWGFWGNANGVSEEDMEKMFWSQGVNRLKPENGIKILESLLCSRVNQVMQIDVKEYVYRLMDINFTRSYKVYDKNGHSNMFLLEQNPAGERADAGSQEEAAAISDFAMQLLVQVIKKTGIMTGKQSGFLFEDLMKKFKVNIRYRRLFKAVLDILVSGGYLERNGNIFYNIGLDEEPVKTKEDLEIVKQQHIQEKASTQSYLELLWVCLWNLPDILSGKKQATDLMFPGGSANLIEGVYKDNEIAQYANEMVVACVRKYMEEKVQKQEKVKILEIGAGTGGTSEKIFDVLEPFKEKVEYVYTDISLSFLQYGKRKYLSERPYLKFELLNIEEDIENSRIKPGEYDLIIAANVLHATKYMKYTIRNAKKLLKDNGWIILNEATENFIFLTLTFGLLDGWWYYEDEDIRMKNSPLLSADMWNQVLREEGFQNVKIIRNIIIGESNGIVVQANQTNKAESGMKPLLNKISKTDENKMKEIPAKSQTEKTREEVYTTVRNAISESIKKALMLEDAEMDYDSSFMDYGVDSILSVKIVNAVSDALKIKFNSTELFDYPTVNELTEYLTDKYYEEIDVMDADKKEPQEEPEDDMMKILKKLEDNCIDVDEAQHLLGGEADE